MDHNLRVFAISGDAATELEYDPNAAWAAPVPE
jgi:hypothetical protein